MRSIIHQHSQPMVRLSIWFVRVISTETHFVDVNISKKKKLKWVEITEIDSITCMCIIANINSLRNSTHTFGGWHIFISKWHCICQTANWIVELRSNTHKKHNVHFPSRQKHVVLSNKSMSTEDVPNNRFLKDLKWGKKNLSPTHKNHALQSNSPTVMERSAAFRAEFWDTHFELSRFFSVFAFSRFALLVFNFLDAYKLLQNLYYHLQLNRFQVKTFQFTLERQKSTSIKLKFKVNT